MAKSIVEDPSQWTSKPKDLFDKKVKESLDNRGWGSGTDSIDATAAEGVSRSQLLREHRYLREQVEEIQQRAAMSSTNVAREINEKAERALNIVSKR